MTASFIQIPGTADKLQTWKNLISNDGTTEEVHSEAITPTRDDGFPLGLNTRDTGNEQTNPLLANQTFTGVWKRIDSYPSIQLLYAALTPLTSVSIQWSNDGVSQISGLFGASTLAQRVVTGYNVVYQVYSGDIIAPYYRLVIVNGASDQTSFPGFISITWLNNTPYNGVFDFLDAPLTNLTKALLVRVASAGTIKSINNSTTTPLAAGATFTGTSEAILAYNQINLKVYGEPSTAKASLYIEFSDDGTNWDISIPALVRNPSLVIPVPLINVGAYYRIRYLNDGGVSAIAALGLKDVAGTPTLQTAFRLQTYLLPTATKEIARTLDQGVSGSDPITLVRAVATGVDPLGVYQNAKADGVALTTTSPLSSSQTYLSPWVTTDGWESVELLVSTTVTSATDGIQIEFTDDASVASPVVRAPTRKYTINSTDAVNGGAVMRFPVRGDGLRVRYINGGSTANPFFLELNLRKDQVQSPISEIESDMNGTSQATMTRDVVTAKNDSGTYGNILRGPNGGFRISVLEHETTTPIRALTSWITNQAVIASTTVAVNVVPAPTSGRKTVAVKALSSNSKTVFIGPTSAVTTGSGWELAAGESIAIEVDQTAGVWVIGTSATAQTLCYAEVA